MNERRKRLIKIPNFNRFQEPKEVTSNSYIQFIISSCSNTTQCIFFIRMERLWKERSKNGIMPTFQIAVLLPQIRKDFEVDEDAIEEKLIELDKGKIL